MHNKQLKLIWVLAHQLKFDYDILHDFVYELTGKKSLKDLRDDETQKVLNKLQKLAGEESDYHKCPVRVNEKGELTEYISKAQLYCIKFYARKLNFTENGLLDYAKRRFKIKDYFFVIADLTKIQAQSLLLFLKSAFFKKQEKQKSKDNQTTLNA